LELDKLKTLVIEHTENEPLGSVRCMLDEHCLKITAQKRCDASNLIEILRIIGHLSCLTDKWDVNDIKGCLPVFELCTGFDPNIESAQLIKELKLNVCSIDSVKSTRIIVKENWQDAILLNNKAFIEHRKVATKAINDVFAVYHCKIGCHTIVQNHWTNFEGWETFFSALSGETDLYVKYLLANEAFFCIVSDVVFRHLSANPYLDNGDFKDWLLRIIQPKANFAELVHYRKIYGRDEVDELFVMLESFKPQASETQLLKYIGSFAAEHFVSFLINSTVSVKGQNFVGHSNVLLHHEDEKSFGIAFAGKFYLIYTSTIFSTGFKFKASDPERLNSKLSKEFGGIFFCDAHLSADGKLLINIVNYSDSDEFNSFKGNFLPAGEVFICIPYRFIAEKRDTRAHFFKAINQTHSAPVTLEIVERFSKVRFKIDAMVNGLNDFYKTVLSPFTKYPIHAATVATFLLTFFIATLFINQDDASVKSVALLTRPPGIQFRGLANIPPIERIEQSGHHLASGQSFQVQYELKKSRYVLVIFIDSLNQHTVLLNETKQQKGIHTLPSEHSAYELDNVPGTESVYILTSKSKMPLQTTIDLLKAGELFAIKRKGINVQHMSFVHTP
jgi:hypothetical protein